MMSKKKTLKPETNININNTTMSREDFEKACIKKLNSMSFDKKSLEKEHIARYKFKTMGSTDIKISLITEAESFLNRKKARDELSKYIIFPIANEIEKGLFERSLTHITENKLPDHFVGPVYEDRLFDICSNLDLNNTKINNTTLILMVYDKSFSPYFTAMLPPDQIHPKRWLDVIKKKQIRDEAINSQPYTDIYTCSKCHESKFKITEIQLRCADEPTNRICQCMVCFHTFIK
jgi:DNA-directed RNA polymerase subunit M/transcription elongation factor TFIIS